MNRKKLGLTLVELMMVIAILGLLVTLGVPGFLRSRNTSRRNTCVNNLRMIEHAADQYRIDRNLAIGTSVNITWLWPASATAKDVSSYINRQLSCPSNGFYVGGNATTGAPGTDKTSDTLINANGFPHCVSGSASGSITHGGSEIEHSIESVNN